MAWHLVLTPGHIMGKWLGLSPRGLKPVVNKLIFYEIFPSFQWIWGFRQSSRRSFKLCKGDFMKGKWGKMKNTGISWENGVKMG